MPRKSRLSLRGRIVVAFGLLGMLLSVVFAAGVHVAYETIERDLIIDVLERELSASLDTEHPADSNAPARIRHYSGDEIPASYRPLAPGFHEVMDGPREDHVLVRDARGARHVLVFHDANIERREETLNSILVAGALIATYLSIWLGFVTSQRVISPVVRLAAEVRGLRDSEPSSLPLRQYADDEVGELARAFREYRDRLVEFMARERSFTGTISHELRTPLTVISNNIDVLLANESIPSTERDRLLRMQRAVRECADLVGAFLLMARSAGRIAGECDPRAIVERIVQDVAERFGTRVDMTFDADAPEFLAAPAAVFTAVTRNLLHNAIEHGREPVRVHLSSDALTVSDAGNGVAIGTKSGRLGLEIVQRLCERQGWRLAVESGDGTRVTVKFPGA